MSDKPVTVSGAGLSGSLMAILLARSDRGVRLIERRPDPRRTDLQQGRSINLAISKRGLDALDAVGLRGEVLDVAVPMEGRLVHSIEGRTTFQPYGRSGQAINSVSRGGLNRLLVEEAGRSNSVEMLFDTRVVDVETESAGLIVESDAAGERRVESEAVIAADGAFSPVRARMMRQDRFSYSQDYLSHAYKELAIPPAAGGGFKLEKNALHIWPRGGFMMIALPNFDGSFTCTLFWPWKGQNSVEEVSEIGPLAFLQRWFPDAIDLIPDLESQFVDNPTSSLVTIRCEPWNSGRVLLLGDSAHAVVPFYGQGANAAMEDCLILRDRLEDQGWHWERAFDVYARERKPHADALADLALANFIEMRDSVASSRFLIWKRIEKLLHLLLPGLFLPLYSMVTFSRIPYADAVERDARQRKVLKGTVLVIVLTLVTLGILGLAR